jgi:antitoxin component of MazEF toxin-antitoxin module
MFKKIFKVGNRLVVAIPRKMLDELGLGIGSRVRIELNANAREIVIRTEAGSIPGVNEVFAQQVAEFINEYRPTLEALAR